MTINTKKVQGRRSVRYNSLDEFLEEAKQFSRMDVQCLGNWSVGQIYKHVAESLDMSIDGTDFKIPAPMRWMFILLMKKKFLTKSIPPGFSSDGTYIPDETPTESGLADLKKAIARQKDIAERVPHPAFGNIGRDGWNDFHLRHAELHMSFLIPSETAVAS